MFRNDLGELCVWASRQRRSYIIISSSQIPNIHVSNYSSRPDSVFIFHDAALISPECAWILPSSGFYQSSCVYAHVTSMAERSSLSDGFRCGFRVSGNLTPPVKLTFFDSLRTHMSSYEMIYPVTLAVWSQVQQTTSLTGSHSIECAKIFAK